MNDLTKYVTTRTKTTIMIIHSLAICCKKYFPLGNLSPRPLYRSLHVRV
jgi:hypothetical protein